MFYFFLNVHFLPQDCFEENTHDLDDTEIDGLFLESDDKRKSLFIHKYHCFFFYYINLIFRIFCDLNYFIEIQ